MNSYQAAIDRFDSQRAAAANAVFRLGECYRKLGKAEEAKTQYARILREFPDQVELARLSQKLLFAEPPRAVGTRSSFQQRLHSIIIRPAAPNTPEEAGPQAQAAYPDALRPGGVSPREKQLIEEEIQLVHQQVDEMNARVKGGVASPVDLIPLRRDLMQLQRQLAQDSPSGLRKSLEEEINLVQQQIKEAQVKQEHGIDSATKIFTLKRELLELQRKLAAVEEAVTPSYSPDATGWVRRPAVVEEPAAIRKLPSPPTPVPPATSAPDTSGNVRETIPGAPSSVQFQPSAPAARAGRAEPGAAPAPRALPTRALRGRSSAQEEKKAQLQSYLARVREQLFNAESQLDLSNDIREIVAKSSPATLPDQAGADPRYQKLKQEFEDAVLSNAENKERNNKIKEALKKIETWVKSIYLPELEAKVEFAEKQLVRYRRQAADLLRALQEEEDKAQAETARQNSETLDLLKPALPTPPAPPPAKF